MQYNIVYPAAVFAAEYTLDDTEKLMIFDKAQLMKGTLEGCILKIISRKTTYGYEILEYLKKNGFSDISEGTIYPLLLRLEKSNYIHSELLPSPLGPKRKYFSISEDGSEYLKAFEECWRGIDRAVLLVLEGDKEGADVK